MRATWGQTGHKKKRKNPLAEDPKKGAVFGLSPMRKRNPAIISKRKTVERRVGARATYSWSEKRMVNEAKNRAVINAALQGRVKEGAGESKPKNRNKYRTR